MNQDSNPSACEYKLFYTIKDLWNENALYLLKNTHM